MRAPLSALLLLSGLMAALAIRPGHTAAPVAESAQAGAIPHEAELLPGPAVQPLLNWVAKRMAVSNPIAPAVVLSRPLLHKLNSSYQLSHDGYWLRGAYVPGAIVLDDADWAWGNVLHLSYLVHELVHHVQYLRDGGAPCIPQMEAEAYAIQNEWLGLMGQSPVPVPALADEACQNNWAALP